MSSAIRATAPYRRGSMPQVLRPHRTARARSARPAARTTATARPPSPTGARSTGRRTCTRSRSTAGRVNYVDIGSGDARARSCSSTGSAASGRTGSRTSRAAAQRAARDRPRPARLRPLADAARARSRSRATARTVDALCERLGLGAVVLVGNSMGGFIAAEVAIQFPQRVDAAGARVRRRHLDRRPRPRGPILTLGRVATAPRRHWARRAIRHDRRRPRARHIALAARRPPSVAA